jgi:putative transport protein
LELSISNAQINSATRIEVADMLDWLFELHKTSPVAHALGLVSLVCAAGMAVGSVKIRGIGLGSAGVLFMGILAAQFSQPVERHTLIFIREFGLTLFVFMIGLQLGPGFFASLRAEGMRLNVLAAALVLLAGILAPLVSWLLGMDTAAIAGLFAGASTNTPALGAAQQALMSIPDMSAERQALPALACAVVYPGAIAGLLFTLVLLKAAFRIDPVADAQRYAEDRRKAIEPLLRRTLVIENAQFDGLTLGEAYRHLGEEVLVSRVRSAGEAEVRTALRDTTLRTGDVILAVGTARLLDRFERGVGRKSDEDLFLAPAKITFKRIAVTNKDVLGKTPAELGLESHFGVEVTRIARGDVEMTAVPGVTLKFGDVLQVVGTAEQLDKAASYLGNSLKALNETQFIPLFAGICLGVCVGSIPIAVPGLPYPVRLGLAGGPLVVALFLGRIGHYRGLVWHIPESANHAFKEFGVSLFFAALGLAAGDQFFATVLSTRGIILLVTGLIVTVVPLLVIGLWALKISKLSFVTLGGMLSGAMTNPPALSFVNNLCRSDAPTLAYATVYPLTTLLRILVAQLLVVLLCA